MCDTPTEKQVLGVLYMIVTVLWITESRGATDRDRETIMVLGHLTQCFEVFLCFDDCYGLFFKWLVLASFLLHV